MSNTISLPHLKANSVVPISLSLSQINGLYVIYSHLIEGLTKEAADELKTKIETKQPLNSREMSTVHITQILQLIHKSAEQNNMIEMKDVDPMELLNTIPGTSQQL